ncbi:MAG: PH domain-containing protein [Allosphingosinicella sp.]
MIMEIETPAEEPGFGMQPLDSRQLWVLRIRLALTLVVLLLFTVALDQRFGREFGSPTGLIPSIAFAACVLALIFLPRRRYRAWGFAEGEDELHIRHGLWIRVQTAVPFGRVQHIDVAQGPVERRLGLARLILHTAGTRNAAIPLPGLGHAKAEEMRDRIRAKIRQDLA